MGHEDRFELKSETEANEFQMLTVAERRAFKELSKAGIEFTYLFTTKTGWKKSTFDATARIRSYFEVTNYHYYEEQEQGPEHKRILPLIYVDGAGQHNLSISLLRPKSGNGDPRFWFLGSKKRGFIGGDVFVLILHEGVLHAFNATQRDLAKDLIDENSLLYNLSKQKLAISDAAKELESMIRGLYERGFVDSLRRGSTGVGYTLETLLGIKENSDKAPDYKGIEIKSGREFKTKPQLFCETPDWAKSPHSKWDALTNFGYPTGNMDTWREDFANYVLRCTVASAKMNPQGFIHKLNSDDEEYIVFNNGRNARHPKEKVFIWDLKTLQDRLLEKHAETFWVIAETKKLPDGTEQFRYGRIIHTKDPSPLTFARLLNDDGITLDFSFKASSAERKTAGDKGFSFKLRKPRFHELFPVVQTIDFNS